jgi:hypothetical protein
VIPTRWSSAFAILRRRLRREEEERRLLRTPAPDAHAPAAPPAAADATVETVVTRVAVWLPPTAVDPAAAERAEPRALDIELDD